MGSFFEREKQTSVLVRGEIKSVTVDGSLSHLGISP